MSSMVGGGPQCIGENSTQNIVISDLLSYGLVSQLLSTMCTLLSSRTREVVKAAFGFIKITIGVLPSSELSPHLEKLVSGVMRWSGDPKSHFRLKARFILEKLMRKFG